MCISQNEFVFWFSHFPFVAMESSFFFIISKFIIPKLFFIMEYLKSLSWILVTNSNSLHIYQHYFPSYLRCFHFSLTKQTCFHTTTAVNINIEWHQTIFHKVMHFYGNSYCSLFSFKIWKSDKWCVCTKRLFRVVFSLILSI